MSDPAALATVLTQVVGMAAAALPAELRNAGAWGLLAVLVGLAVLSLAMSAFQSTARFLLRLTWPALVLLALQAAGLVPVPPAVSWRAEEVVDDVIHEDPADTAWWR